MTTVTRTPIVCQCGHKGNEVLRENDQPFSTMYESYRVEGFEGSSFTVTNISDMPSSILEKLSPHCPICGETGKVKYV